MPQSKCSPPALAFTPNAETPADAADGACGLGESRGEEMISGQRCTYCGEWVLEPCKGADGAAACAPDIAGRLGLIPRRRRVPWPVRRGKRDIEQATNIARNMVISIIDRTVGL
jgi:hypothetical protein